MATLTFSAVATGPNTIEVSWTNMSATHTQGRDFTFTLYDASGKKIKSLYYRQWPGDTLSELSMVFADLDGNTTYQVDSKITSVSAIDPVVYAQSDKITVKTPIGKAYIFVNNNWVPAIPYIFKDGSWKQATPFIFTGDKWK